MATTAHPTTGTTSTPAAEQTTATDLFDEHGRFAPAPGTEYPFSVGDISYAVARLLGSAWVGEAGYWGTTGSLGGPYTASFAFMVDEEGDLLMTFDRMVDDAWPKNPSLPEGFRDCEAGVYLEGASSADGLDYLAEQYAAAVRAVTGC